MEDLIPLLLVILIAAVYFLKHAADKSGKKPRESSGETAPEQKPVMLEEFFAELERKITPQPREMPEWPEAIERPDYIREMEAFEARPPETEPVRQPEPARYETPAVEEVPASHVPVPDQIRHAHTLGKAAIFKIPSQGAIFSGLGRMHLSMPPMLRSATGHTRFELGEREQLRQALIASMVFGQPRAYDYSFDTTLAK